MEFLLLLFLIFLGFCLWPLIKVALFYRRVKKQFNNAKKSFNEQYRQSRERSAEEQQNKSKKIFDKDVGEYVTFEEITYTSSQYSETVSDNGSTSTFESQTTDVEWEDI